MADNLMRASPQALALLGLSPDDHPRPVVADTVQPSLQAIALAMRQSWRLGGEEARMAEFPNDFAKADEDLPSVWERGARGIAAGFASLIPASMTLAGGIIDFMGADEAGQGVAQSGIDVQTWLDQHVAVENPQFFDHLMMGVGSMASFLIPGIGAASAAGRAAQGLKLAGAAAKAFTAVTGAGAMSFLEAGVEQSQRQQELMGQGMTAEQAFAASQPVFWQNMALLTVSNAAGYFSPVGKLLAGTSKARARIAQGVLAAFTEGGQERVQSVIQDVAAGRARWEDFADPSKYQTETLVGALVGGVAGGLTAETEPPAAPTTPAPGQEPPAPAPTGQELADSPLPADDLPLPKDFDLFTGDEEPAGAPTPPPAGTSEPVPATEMPQPEGPAQANVEPPAAEEAPPAEAEAPDVAAQPEAPAQGPAPAPAETPANISTLPIETIATEPETFQVRSEKGGGGFDEDFVRNAVENFDEQAVNPIEVWLNPKTGKYTVIDGHHTLEILKRAGKKIAAVKIFKGTREQAIKASQERNDSRRANDPLARAAVVRGWREAGRTKKDVKAEAARLYGKDANTVIALSHLNPSGRVMDTLRQFSGADQVEVNSLLQIAKWIGSVRAADPKITDAHEGEMFDYLRENIGKPGSDTEIEFRKYIEGRIGGLGMFDYSQALNLKNAPSRSPAQRNYDEQLAEAKRNKAEAEKELNDKAAEFKAATQREEHRITEEKAQELLAPYIQAVKDAETEYAKVLLRKTEISNIRSSEPTMFKILPGQRRQFSKVASKYEARNVVTNMTITEDEVGPEAALIKTVAKRLGAKVVFFRADPGRGGGTVGGFYNSATQTIFINIDAASRSPLLVIAMHELGHHMQHAHPAQWRQMYFVALDNISPAAKAVHEAMKAKLGYTPDQFAGELMSDIMEEAGARESFWAQLAIEHPSAFANAVAKIRDIIAAIKTAFAANRQFKLSPHLKSIQRMDAAIANAMRIAAERTAAGQQQNQGAQRSMFKIMPPKSTGRAVMDRLLGDQDSAKARIKARERNWKDFPRVLYQKMVDRNSWHYVAMKNTLKAAGIDVEKYDMAKNPHLVLQRMAAWTEKADLALRHVVTSWDGAEVLSDGLEVIIRKFNLADAIDNGEFGQFMIAARLKAMHDVNGDDFFGPDTLSDGSPNPEYEAAQAEFGDYMEVYNEFGSQQWQDAAAALTEWSNAIMQRLLQSGAISQEQYDGMVDKYDIYAPLYVLEREEENRTAGGSKPKPTAGRVTWQMDRLIPGQVRMDPIEGMIKNVYRIEFLAANNSAKLAAANFVADMHKTITGRKGSNIPGYGRRVAPKVNPVTKYVGDLLKAAGLSDKQIQSLVDSGQVKDLEAQAKMWVTSSYLENGVVALMRDGEVEYWQFEPDIYNVFASINDKASHQLMSYFTLQTRLLRAGAVLTPEFMARNQFRDFLSAGVLSQNLVKNPVDAALLPLRIMRGLSHAIKKDEVWKQFVMSDAAQANLVALDQENLKKRADEITRESRTSRQRAGQAVKSPAKYIMHSHPLAVLQAFSKLTENSTRLAVWEKTYNDAIAAGKTHNQARAQAAIQARESSTDFGRAGEYGRVINRIIPFFNASIQGNDKMVRALIVDKGNRGATWIRGAMMITLPSVLLWAINRDDEWYKEQPAWLKNHFWLFSLDGGKTIIKLPKPFEVGMIFGSLPERFLDWAYGEDPKAVGRWADNMLNDVGVLQPGSLGGPLISTIIEVEQNYDAYRGTPIVKGWLQDVVPREQYTANTSEFAKWMGEKFPGGRMSPLMVDHFIRGSFGGLGSWGAEIASNIIMEADPGRREMKPASRLMFDRVPDWMPVLRGLAQTGPTSYTQDLDDMYEEFDRTREAVTTMRALQSGGASKEKFVQLYRERGVDLALNEAVSKGIEPIAKISQQIKFIQSVPADVMDRAAKRARIDELTAMRNTLVTEFMKKYRTIDRDSIQAQVEASIGKVERELDRSKGR